MNPVDKIDYDKDFNLSSADIQPSVPQDEPEEEVEDIPQPGMTEKQLQDLLEFKLILTQQNMQNTVAHRQLENQRKTLERDLQLEARLEPLDLTDLVVKGELTQKIPIDPDKFHVEFRTIPHVGVLIAEKVGKEIANEWSGSSSSIAPEHARVSSANVAQMVQALISINGVTGPGAEVASIKDRDKLTKRVKELTEEWMQRPHLFLEQLTSHYLGFVARVRNVLNHAGYVDQEVKKS